MNHRLAVRPRSSAPVAGASTGGALPSKTRVPIPSGVAAFVNGHPIWTEIVRVWRDRSSSPLLFAAHL